MTSTLPKPSHLLVLDVAGLQTTRLGNHLEDRVNKFLRRQNHPEAGEVFVRVVASSDKTVEVKPGMKSRFVCRRSSGHPTWLTRALLSGNALEFAQFESFSSVSM